jgi:tRNA1Val (adenine37-N6)-methyltransferase
MPDEQDDAGRADEARERNEQSPNEQLERRRAQMEATSGESITVDGLTRLPGRTWSIFQRRRGHRHSTDDLLTGWYALASLEAETPALPVTRCLDLGTGIGSVGLLVLSGLADDARLTCIEAQDVSFRFLLENLAANGIEERVRPIHGDLRALDLGEHFPLVTGSPPYFDARAGIVPADSQKAHARFELRGDVRDYAQVAARHLEPGGRFVFCFPWPQRSRAIAAARDEGFASIIQRDVVPREGLAPLFSLFACRREAGSLEEAPPFVVRHADGSHTDAMHAVRARFGWPPQV